MPPAPAAAASAGPIEPSSSSPTLPGASFNLADAVASLPTEKQNEIAIVQGMLQQLIRGAEPTPPAALPEDKARAMVMQARTMYQHYTAAMNNMRQMQAANASSSVADAAVALPRPPSSPLNVATSQSNATKKD